MSFKFKCVSCKIKQECCLEYYIGNLTTQYHLIKRHHICPECLNFFKSTNVLGLLCPNDTVCKIQQIKSNL